MPGETHPPVGEGTGARGLLAQVMDAKRRRDWVTADGLLRQALAARPEDPLLRASYADLLVRRGDPDEGLALADAVLSEHPGHGAALVARGLAAERLHRPRDAVAAFEAAWAAAPSAFVARRLARARSVTDGAAAALAFVRQALERFPADAGLRQQEALLLEATGRSEEAAEVYRVAVGAAPDDGFAFARMLRATLAGRPPDEALAALAPVLRLQTRARNPHVLGLKAELEEAAERWEEAAASWEAALAVDPSSNFHRARLAYACRRAGRREAAFGLLREVLEADPADPAALRAFVADAGTLGRRDEAADFLADLIRRHPGRRPLWGWVRRLRRPEDAGPAAPTRSRRSGAGPQRGPAARGVSLPDQGKARRGAGGEPDWTALWPDRVPEASAPGSGPPPEHPAGGADHP